VVKELLENSIDAGANAIELIVKDSGKTLIQVNDDGIGMSFMDARMSFERHATSKIRETEDLFSIRTMGFRGEALASIAAVAQVELKTKRASDELGVVLEVEGSKVKRQEPEAATDGTSISVKNLFFNVPARRNFLKSDSVEYKHIIEEFQRVALGYPAVQFCLFHNDTETFHLKSGNLSQRIVGLFGKNYREQLVQCEEDTDRMKIFGYIGKPEFAKKTRGEQFFFVNGRYIRNGYLNHAVMNAYEGLLQEGALPLYVLFIQIDPVHIDVNVHPTKTEIKFDDERTVYGIIGAATRSALARHNVTPTLDFDLDVNFGALQQPSPFGKEPVKDKQYSNFKTTPPERANLANWERIFDPEVERSSLDFSETTSSIQFTIDSKANTSTVKNEDVVHTSKVFQLHNEYIVTQVKSGMMLVDQEQAHERILYEKCLQNMQNMTAATQQNLFPDTIELNPSDHALVSGMENEIKALGFDFDLRGSSAIVVNGVPADFSSRGDRSLFEGLIEQFKANKAALSLDVKENLARSMAKRSSIGKGTSLTSDEMSSIIDQLFACANPNYGPDGKVTFRILDLNKIANYFN
jgi:DNA mismatch repair protein MutL